MGYLFYIGAFTGGGTHGDNTLSSGYEKREKTVQQPINQALAQPVSLNGLDEVFEIDSTLIERSDQADMTVISGLTIKQASEHYKLAIPTIRLKIKTGNIPAKKINGPKGPEWRIFPNGMPTPADNLAIVDSEDDDRVIEALCEPDSTVSEGFHQAHINLAALIKSNQELVSKLEAVSYRNGYLEAQLAEKESQIKLLTDSKQSCGRWERFCRWLLGVR